MEINVLIENTALNNNYVCEHGISLYFKVKNKNILFDTGSTGIFIDNAITLGIDIKDVDYCVISHGHNDHGGGLKRFLELNDKAIVYVKKNAFNKHFSKKSEDNIVNIGLDEELLINNRIKVLYEDSIICDDVITLCNVKQLYPMPITNGNLLKLEDDKYCLDNFDHEQNLVIRLEDNKYVLICGCAHNGIQNIMEQFKRIYKVMPTYVIGGFHLSSRTMTKESDEFIEYLAEYLISTKAMFYTCHCTGLEAYQKLKTYMQDKIEYVSAGSKINLE